MDAQRVYENTADTLKNRILALIPSHPEILTMDSAWGLHDVDGFECSDLGPSAAQAGWALGAACREYNERMAIS